MTTQERVESQAAQLSEAELVQLSKDLQLCYAVEACEDYLGETDLGWLLYVGVFVLGMAFGLLLMVMTT